MNKKIKNKLEIFILVLCKCLFASKCNIQEKKRNIGPISHAH
jgi:hypothetical protein